MSGWWFSASASSPTRFTNARASRNDGNSNVRSSAPSTSLQSAVVTPSVSTTVHESRDSRRAGPELVLQYVFRPLSNLVVPVLQRTRVDPVVALRYE